VLGILQSATYGWFAAQVWLGVGAGALVLAWFLLHLRSREKRGRQPLLHLRLFHHTAANLGMGTQLVQWLVLQGAFFVISVYLQEVRHYNAVQTGLMLTPATLGVLISSAAAERLAARRSQRRLIIAGFATTTTGMVLLLALVRPDSPVASLVPGLLLMGLGIGVMLTSSVNVVQSSFPDADQGDISGLSRSVSNLGSSLGTALAGSILIAATFPAGRPYAASIATLAVVALTGLVLAVRIPRAAAGSSPVGEPGSPRHG
jgi:predicted MFS family arabinose efflux permease